MRTGGNGQERFKSSVEEPLSPRERIAVATTTRADDLSPFAFLKTAAGAHRPFRTRGSSTLSVDSGRPVCANRAVVAQLEWNRFAHGRAGRLERAKALLEVLKR
jgi:hypothetical protein